MAGGSKLAVSAAIAGNGLISIAKFVGFAVTGSGSLLSEAVHSVADTMNQVLLLIGVQRAGRKADTRFHYGYRREQYVFAMISAVGIFFLGCGVTVYHGVSSLLDPHHAPSDLGWAIGVLVAAAVVEGLVLALAVRELKKQAGDRPLWRFARHEADPAMVAVLLEDSVAVLGVLIALVCIVLTKLTHDPAFDAIGSILVGVLLGLVAIWLIVRNHQSLVGPAAPIDVQRQLRQVVESADSVAKVVGLRSRVIDSQTYDFEIRLVFDGEAIARKRFAERLKTEREVASSTPEAFEAFAMSFATDLVKAVGDEIDELEAQIREAIPAAKFLDIEAENRPGTVRHLP